MGEIVEPRPSGGDGDRDLPIGTQVVTCANIVDGNGAVICPMGTVGTVIALPGAELQPYHVRLPDGRIIHARRQDLAVRKEVQRQGLLVAGADATDLYQYVIYRCVVGSRAYGLATAGSDTDRRGFYLPPAALQWSLSGVPEQLENRETEESYWELRKFLTLALKANPNVLECLYSPLVETATPLARALLSMRGIFLSRLVYQTYNGYVMSQFKRLNADLRAKGEIRWKHAMHLIRLLLAGITVLREGYVPVLIEEHRDRLLAIRGGGVPWEEIDAWRLKLHGQFDAAFATTRLPERPDYEQANAYLIKARRSMVE